MSQATNQATEPTTDPASLGAAGPVTFERHICLDGPGNFRDIGGYRTGAGQRVRWRRVFRSDGLETLSPRDRRVVVEELRIGVVIDLRSSREAAERGTFPVGTGAEVVAVRLCPNPVFDDVARVVEEAGAGRPDGFRMAHLLTYMIETCSDRLVGALRLLAEVEEPVVFHCAAGKDRTGLLAALLLGVLGVDEADILDDYGHSRRAVPLLRKRWEERVATTAPALAGTGVTTASTPADGPGPGGTPVAAEGATDIAEDVAEEVAKEVAEEVAKETVEELLSAEPATLGEALAFLRRRHGSIERWATDHGATSTELARLRSRLLEPAPGGTAG